MPRTLPAAVTTGIGLHITDPSYLVELLLDTPVYYTTMDAVDWDSKSWLANAVRLDGVSELGGTLVLRNDDSTGSALVLNNITRDKEVRIYKYYNGDAQWLYQLYMGETDIRKDEVAITLYATRLGQALAPRKRIIGPAFTNILAPGVVIRWGDERLRVES